MKSPTTKNKKIKINPARKWQAGDPHNGRDSTYSMVCKYAEPVGGHTHKIYYSYDWTNRMKSTCPNKKPSLGLMKLKNGCFAKAVASNDFVSIVIKDAMTRKVLEIYNVKKQAWEPFQEKISLRAWVCYYEQAQMKRLQQRLTKNETIWAKATSPEAALIDLQTQVATKQLGDIARVQVYDAAGQMMGYLNPNNDKTKVSFFSLPKK